MTFLGQSTQEQMKNRVYYVQTPHINRNILYTIRDDIWNRLDYDVVIASISDSIKTQIWHPFK